MTARRIDTGWRIVIAVVVIVASVVLIRTAWLDDDAYITFRTVDNFLHGYGLRWNVDERVQTFTNPLWMFVMSGAAAITHDVYYTSIAMSMVLTLGVLVLVVRTVAMSIPAAVFGASVLLLSKSFVEYSTSGLENPLTHFLLLLVVLTPILVHDGRRRLLLVSLFAALLMLNRLDTALLVAPLVATEVWRSGIRSRHTWTAVAFGAAPLVAWELFSLVYYGFLVPNTAYAKLGAGIPRADLVQQGVLYLLDAINNDPLTPLVILTATVSPIVLGGSWIAPLGIASYVAYTVWVGGDFMSGRFLSAPLLLSVVCLLRQPRLSVERMRPIWLAAVGAVWLITLLPPPPVILSGATYGTDIDPLKLLGPNGIMDERRWYYPGTGLLTAQPGVSMPHHKWLYMGYDLVRRHQRFFLTDAAGFIGYAAGPTVHLIDWNALADPLLARLPSEAPWRIGHHRRAPPDGYVETIETGRNVIRDPSIAAFYDKLRVITRGPLWSAERWRTILAMNLGRYDGLVKNYDRVRVRLDELSIPKPDGTKWNERGNVVMTPRGVEVAVQPPRQANRIQISVSNNDTYRVVFLKDGRQLSAADIDEPPVPGGDLQTFQLPAPAEPFDAILVIPADGDYRYSLGSIVPLL